jgi:hypothetical protein
MHEAATRAHGRRSAALCAKTCSPCFYRNFTDRTQESANALPAGGRAGLWLGAGVGYCRSAGRRVPGQEDMVEDAPVATGGVAKNADCELGLHRAWIRSVQSRLRILTDPPVRDVAREEEEMDLFSGNLATCLEEGGPNTYPRSSESDLRRGRRYSGIPAKSARSCRSER